MKKKLLSFATLLLCAVGSAWADDTSTTPTVVKSWDFTTLSQDYITAIEQCTSGDGATWVKKSNTGVGEYYTTKGGVGSRTITTIEDDKKDTTYVFDQFKAGNTVIYDGLKFYCGVDNNQAQIFFATNKCMHLDTDNDVVCIEGLTAGQYVVVEYSSSSKSTGNFVLTNAKTISGSTNFGDVSAERTISCAVVRTNGDVTLKPTRGSYVYRINVYSGFTLDADGKTTTSTVDVAINKHGRQTFSSEYSLDFSKTNVTAYVASGYTVGDTKTNTSSTVALTPITDNIVPANTGVILKTDDEGTVGKTIKVPITLATVTATKNYLVAAKKGGTVPASVTKKPVSYTYVYGYINEDASTMGFYEKPGGAKTTYTLTNDGGTETDGRAYLLVDKELVKEESSSAKMISLDFGENEVTGISEVTTSAEVANGVYYTLSGVPVTNPQKGIYILNGKKVIVR